MMLAIARPNAEAVSPYTEVEIATLRATHLAMTVSYIVADRMGKPDDA